MLRWLFILSILMSFSFSQAENKKPLASGFVLYFQPLHEFDWAQTRQYLKELKSLLKSNKKPDMKNLLIQKTPAKICLKKGINICRSFFKEPVFNRIEWNKFSLNLNHYCNSNKNEICEKLSLLHNQNIRIYNQLVRTRKEKRKELMKKPYQKVMDKKKKRK